MRGERAGSERRREVVAVLVVPLLLSSSSSHLCSCRLCLCPCPWPLPVGVISSGFKDLIAKVGGGDAGGGGGGRRRSQDHWDRGAEDTREAYVVDADTPRGSSSTATFPWMLPWSEADAATLVVGESHGWGREAGRNT